MTNERDEHADDDATPEYVARYRAAERARRGDERAPDHRPLYLRLHRRQEPTGTNVTDPDVPLWRRSGLAVQRALTEDNRNKEIGAPPSAIPELSNDVFLIRHGETQGYSTDSGLTPHGIWQAHTYGLTMAKRFRTGEHVVFRHADTNRARETAEHIRRGFVDGCAQFEKDIAFEEPEPMDEFRNFQFVAPDGLKDITAAYREYYSVRERYERTDTGDRPLWLVEMDRFMSFMAAGGEPIQKWLTTPTMHFEPPSMAVRRFWAGIDALSSRFPGARLMVATHSGCIRAFAVHALGHDPGEPRNTEHVRVKLLDDGRRALIAYRNRVEEITVPDLDALPVWDAIAV
jgi:broad specificity phosphatase PhoE